MNSQVEQAVRLLIVRHAVHKKKGTVMGNESWVQLIAHFWEEIDELDQELEESISNSPSILSELGDLYGILVHAVVKAGFTMDQLEAQTLKKFNERFL